MKQHDFSNFKIWCSEIHSLFSVPKGVKPTKNELKRYERLVNSPDEKNEDELAFVKRVDDKIALYNEEPLSKATINALMRQYGQLVYNKKVASIGDAMSFLKKGTDMEAEAIELLSKIDKREYKLNTETTENDFLVGRCDIYHPEGDKVLDTKVSWNVNAFLKARTSRLDPKYWYQMQGYMELYDVNHADVVFLLLNTPPELIEREKIKLINKFMIGEIERDKYEIDIENIESAFTYSNIPIKRRYFRYRIKREPKLFEKAYKKVEKARLWMRDFEKDIKTNIFVVPSENYLKIEENNAEPDPTESLQND